MPLNNQIYLLRFYAPVALARLPKQERAGCLHSYFNQCMGQIASHLSGFEVVSRQEYLLSAALQGPEFLYDDLKRHLEKTHLGELVPDMEILAAGTHHR